MKLLVVALLALSSGIVAAQDTMEEYHEIYDTTEPKVEAVDYFDTYDNNYPLTGYVSLPDTTPAPAVVIIPDNTNVDEYEMIRATMFAEEYGWVGFAADIYGDVEGIDNSTIRRAQTGLYRGNNTLFYGRIQAAVDAMKEHPDVMADKIAVIGYCFGGTGILTYSFLGATDVVGAVSLHGGLTSFPMDHTINHPVLVLSGGADDTGTELDDLEASLNTANATWQITRYSGIEHAFTKWDDRRYNARADYRSWHETASFLAEAFGEISYAASPPDATDVETLEYDDNGFALTGYLSIPEGAEMGKTPAVVVVPDWDGNSGPDGYEATRATLLAEEGYIGFAADIFGSDNQQVDDFSLRRNLTITYRTNYTLFVSRIQAAVDEVAAHDLVDPEKVFLIGYCFGGTGVVDYAFTELKNVKAVVPFHGGLTSLAPIQTEVVYPYVLVQSGGIDDAHGNNTELEMELDRGNATWEITRYSNVQHGFTEWGAGRYHELADWRSWDAMMKVFEMIQDHDLDGTMADDHDDHDHDHDHDHEDEVEEDEDGDGAEDDVDAESGSDSQFVLGHILLAVLLVISSVLAQ